MSFLMYHWLNLIPAKAKSLLKSSMVARTNHSIQDGVDSRIEHLHCKGNIFTGLLFIVWEIQKFPKH